MSSQSVRLSNQIKAAEEEVRKLNREAKELGETKVPTREYQELDKDLTRAKESLDRAVAAKKEFAGEKLVPTQEYRELSTLVNQTAASLEKLYDSQKKMDETGVRHSSSRWKNTQYSIEQLEKQMEYYRADLQDTVDRQRDLEESTAWKKVKEDVRQAGKEFNSCKKSVQELTESGKAFTLGYDTDVYKKKIQQIDKVNAKLREYDAKVAEIRAKEEKAGRTVSNIGKSAAGVFKTAGNVLTGLDNTLNSVGKTAKKVFRRLHSDTRKENGFLATLKSRLKGITLSLLVFNWITRGFNAMTSGIKEGLQNLARYSEEYNRNISALMSANTQLKNSLATAFQPIIQLAVPCLIKLINYVTKAANTVAQLFAVLSGKNTWTKAKEVNEDYRESLDDVTDSAEEAQKALEGYLSPIDTVNKYHADKESSDSGKGSGSTAGDMFEEVAVSEDIRKMAEEIKKILSGLFAPFKEAWNREGKFVMDSWKEGLSSVGSLVRTIGKDFLAVWNQERTIQAISDILHIVGDIGLVVHNLASGFENAWKKNETGLHILENIRNIFAAIIANIRSAADYTVEWSRNLNFTPLLEAFERFTASLEPMVDALSGILADFYKQVLLPLGKWTIEEGLPQLLDIFTALNERIDWQGLRQRLSDFWEHLEPFAEKVGEGLIIFIDKCAEALGDFVESGAFESFLTKVEEWMDKVEPEDVANALERIAEVLVGLKFAVAGFKIISAGLGFIKKLFSLLSKFKGMDIGNFGMNAGATGLLFSTLDRIKKNRAIEQSLSNTSDKLLELNKQLESGGISLEEYNNQVEALRIESEKEMVFKINGLNPDDYDSNGWNKKLSVIGEKISTWWESMKEKYSWSTLFTDISQWWDENIAPWFTQEKWSELFSNIKAGAEAKWNEFTQWWQGTALSKWWSEHVSPWFTKEKWSGLWNSVKQAFHDKWDELVNWWKGTAISKWWDKHVKPWFTKEKWSGILSSIKDSFKTIWDRTVGQWKQNITDWWNEHVAPWFTVEKWESVLGGIVSSFRGIFSDVVSVVSDKMSAAFDKVVGWVSKIKDVVRGIFSTVSSVIGNIGSSISGMFSSRSSSASLLSRVSATGYTQRIKIPGYATGTVIPPSMSRHLAILGDNNRESEVVSPLSTIEKAVDNVMGKYQNGGGNYQFTAQINRKTLFDEFIREAKLQQMVKGKNPFELT